MSYNLGIDMGTSYTSAAVLPITDARAEPVVLPLGERRYAIPSVLFLRQDGQMLVGEAAERRAEWEPDRGVREFKRRFGDPIPIILDGTPWAVPELTARLVHWVIDQAAEREGGPAQAIAVTHPATWGPFKRELLAAALNVSGLRARLVAEPVAAATSYVRSGYVVSSAPMGVYDLGGGSFEAAVVDRTGSGFHVLGHPEGLERLGGIDFDEVVLDCVRERFPEAFADLDAADPAVRFALARLRRECMEAKEALSADTEVSIPVLTPAGQGHVRLHRSEFEAVIRPHLEDTVSALHRAIGSAGLVPEQLSAVLLVGGSSRIPLVARLVAQHLGLPVVVDAYPATTIARGAVLTLDAPPTIPARASSVVGPAVPLDDDVQFTVYRPAGIRPARWYPLLAYAHKTTLVEGPTGELVDPVALIDQEATRLLREEGVAFDRLGTDRPLELSRGSEVLLEPWVDGGEVEPLRVWLRWTRPVHHAAFQLRVPVATEGQLVDGGLRVFLGLVLIGEVRFQITVSSTTPPPARTIAEPLPVRRFRRIFASYSHLDTDVVRAVARYATLTGDRYIIDVQDLRAGEPWQPRLAELIEESDIFQLFWSHNAMESDHVRREWKHALQLGREGFIRPVYWQEPLPADPRRRLPPKKLRELHWSKLDTHDNYVPPTPTSRVEAPPAWRVEAPPVPRSPSASSTSPPIVVAPDRPAGADTWRAPSPAERPRRSGTVVLIAVVAVLIAALVVIIILARG
jgi:actin-like ATPase involved in cell morphogenesis